MRPHGDNEPFMLDSYDVHLTWAYLTHEELGLHITLLGHAWSMGGLPGDDRRVAKLARLHLRRFRRIWAGLEGLWVWEGRAWVPNPPLVAGARRPHGQSRYVPRSVREEVLARDGRTCQLCGTDLEADEQPDLDHRIPLAVGGETTPDNLQVAHARCNRQKGARVE